jgi:hypothetical protein
MLAQVRKQRAAVPIAAIGERVHDPNHAQTV